MSARRPIVACVGLGLLLLALLAPAAAQASFGLNSLTVSALNRDESVDMQAGSHPYEWKVSFQLNQDSEGVPEGALRDLVADLPPGLVGNPLAAPRCSGSAFEGGTPQCPGNTQVGIAHIELVGLGIATTPVYNLTPPLGVPARVGFSLLGFNGFQEASLRTGDDYGVTVSDITIPNLPIKAVTEAIWGVPAAPSHDSERFCPDGSGGQIEGCSSEASLAPFFTLPTACVGPQETTVSIDSVEEPGAFVRESAPPLDEEGNPAGLTNCEAPPFKPTITAQPESTVSDSPSGMHINLHIPQNEDPEGLATAHLKDTVLTLPKGVVVNPSAAGGRAACGSAEVDLHGTGPANCPANSRIGTVEVETPLLDHPISGAVYLAKQGDNPFNSLLAVYIAVDDPISGVVVKLAGKVEPDPVTGQLRTTFLNNPQLPFEDFDVDLQGGPRAALTTPPVCGAYTTEADLTPWTSPEGKDAFLSDSFSVNGGPGGPCSGSEAQMPNKPTFEAGTAEPLAGAYSPFVLKLNRENGSQRLKALNVTLPPGVTAKLAGVQECSNAQVAGAEARKNPGEGVLEKASPSCPQASEVGVVNVGAGSGSPFFVQGHAYLAGPYKGAPLSAAIITPAVAGPFDLGTVVVRAALQVDPETAQVTVKSDPIPAILQGIPLDVRAVAVQVNKQDFTLNPTSCEAMAVTGEEISTAGALAPLSDRFQVGGCRGLDYAPKLAIKFKGATHRRAHPKLIATLTAKPGEANTSFAQVKLPKAAFLDNAHIGTVCTRPAYAAESCPAASIYGRAEAITPLLGYPLKGNVYLRSNPAHKLPDLVVGFRGPPNQPIKFDLAGKTDSVKGALRNTFEYAPDVPVSKFRLELFGGKRGLIEMSSGFCSSPNATVKLRAHNNKTYETNPKVQADCGQKPKKKSGHPTATTTTTTAGAR